jgi:hypothetical protein
MHSRKIDAVQIRAELRSLRVRICPKSLRARDSCDRDNRLAFPGWISEQNRHGETHSLTVPDWSPEVDISQDNHEYLLKDR